MLCFTHSKSLLSMVLLYPPSSSSGSSPDTQRKPGLKGGYVTHPFLSFAIEERAQMNLKILWTIDVCDVRLLLTKNRPFKTRLWEKK